MASHRAFNSLVAGTRTNSVLTKPTGTVAGDLMVMCFDIENDILPQPPTGWRFGYYVDHASQLNDLWIFWKRAGASEGADYTIAHASTWTNGYIVTVQNVSPSVNPAFSAAAQGTGTTATANGLTTAGNDAWIGHFVVTFDDMGAITPPTGSTPTFTERYESTNNIYAADGVLASVGSTGTKAVTFGGSQAWIATLMAIEDTATTSTNPFIVQPAYNVLTASASPSVTLNVPVIENDVVIMWPSSTVNTTTITTVPSGWVNVLGGTTMVASDSHAVACVYHKVTAAEASAQTLTYTATNLFTAAATGTVQAALVRNVDSTTPIDSANSTFNSGNTITPHVLASLTGTNLSTGSLVLSCVVKDATGAYATLPTGWEFLTSYNVNQGAALLRREELTTVNVDVTATNITPSAGDEYASITVALTKAPTGAATVTGSKATETDTGNAGVVLELVTGSKATETDTANAGAALVGVMVTGSKATETDTGNAGAALIVKTGAKATGTDTGNAGAALVVKLGGKATETDTANAGAALVVKLGGKATETDTGNAGVVLELVTGSKATETDTANAGTPIVDAGGVTVTGSKATETDTGNAGVVLELVTGSKATETDTGNAGTPVTGAVTVAGSKATETDTANAGAALVLLAGGKATETDTGNHGLPAVVRPGSQAAETDTGRAGAALVLLAGGKATETDTGRAGAAIGPGAPSPHPWRLAYVDRPTAIVYAASTVAVVYANRPTALTYTQPATALTYVDRPTALVFADVA